MERFRSLTTNLFIPILAVAESSGIDVVIPAGATVDYQSIESVFGVLDLRWNGEAYFANVEDVLEGCRGTGHEHVTDPRFELT
jgi:hypothetical protein